MLINLFLNWLALYFTANIIPGIKYRGNFSLFMMVIVIGILNILIRPLLFILTLPVTIVSFGLFIFIINGIIFYWAAKIVKDFDVKDIFSGIAGWIIYSFFSLILSYLLVY